MNKTSKPVFYDATGRRRQWLKRALFCAVVALAGAGAWVAESLRRPPVLDESTPAAEWLSLPQSGGRTENEIAGLPVQFHGRGELLAPRVTQDEGQPAALEIQRAGGGDPSTDLRLVLTFDDGPDARFTPQILDILKANGVPAVFFVVGTNAAEQPALVRRIVREGHEIGNHTFSHPDLSKVPVFRQDLEMAVTQRVIQVLADRSTRLFRPPYGGNPEPRGRAEVVPIWRAARAGYVTIGEGIIPSDWELTKLKPGVQGSRVRESRTAEDLAQRVIRSRHEGHIVLLHDGGGNRSLTVAALPRMISELRGMGYRFVSLAELCGVPKEEMMPPIAASEARLVQGVKAIYLLGFPMQRLLSALFVGATFFGLFRVSFLLVLVLLQRREEKRRCFREEFFPAVTVIMAAYNEEKVIVRSVDSLLRADYPALDLVVVNDGSTDGTLRLLQENFGRNARVRILDQPNSGKMAAMNRALGEARGEIIMLADADTLFPPDAVRMLARHFHDPRIGAVAAGVRIGNAADNVLTRWQALEYSTCQNFDRRGFDYLNCIPVIAGAAGAVRREAIVALGGFSPETLNEDMDMTWQLIRAGWRVVNDSEAVGYTEAPNTLRSFLRQRFRWAYGTYQCLWKHRDALGRYGALGWVALPIQWLHQVLFPLLSPIVDVLVIGSLLTGHAGTVTLFALLMLAIESVGAIVAIVTGGGNPRLLLWLPLQRIGYHPFMWYVVVKACFAALAGTAVGWNKFARAGTAKMGGDGAIVRRPEEVPWGEARGEEDGEVCPVADVGA